PFDRLGKKLVEEHPSVILRWLGFDAATDRMEPLRAETSPPVLVADYVGALTRPGEPLSTLHIEFAVTYRSEHPAKMARYGASLAYQYQRPVHSALILMKESPSAALPPTEGEDSIGSLRVIYPFQTVRLWELDPAPLLEDPALMPWVLLTRSGREEAQQVARRIVESKKEAIVSEFLTLGRLRYDRGDLEAMLGGSAKMSLTEELIEYSPFCQELIERGAAKGRLQGVRQLFVNMAEPKFPGIESMPELQLISNPESFERLIAPVVTGADRTTLEQAIRDAAASSDKP
ncbi:Rpn family recombination-promoting nuclease/putative transposase, partial [Aetokthonos hydrillicola]|uniref:Rpn family recombination-promoting nuclease/putative transposase n=1 Tax=Aetokthonos hydrillicola TaxID=1550245 RepID=UPI001ABBD69E